jgi:hypothetical protein
VNAFRVTPARQSLGRDITPLESALAEALEAIFATGEHDLQSVATELQDRGVSRPSGTAGAWTVSVLEQELRQINHSLDAAYVDREGVAEKI